VTEGHGVPVGVVAEAANRHDSKLVEETLDARVIQPPPQEAFKQNLCLDAGYDSLNMPDRVEAKGLIPHIRSRDKERDLKKRIPGYRARRWVVERTHSWMNRFRRILIRWEKRADNYLAMLQFACAIITLQACEVFG
jgi:transposase